MFDLITNKENNVKNDVLSGITVALALVPEAVAFAFVAGVEPMVGLYAAFMMGLITSAIGGRPGHDIRSYGRDGRRYGGLGCTTRG